MLLILNLPLIGLFVRILYTPMPILLVSRVIFAVIGAYLTTGIILTLAFLIAFGAIGMNDPARRGQPAQTQFESNPGG